MSWPAPVIETIRRLDHVRQTLSDAFVGREPAIELLILATVCQEHLLLLGPPGTAKTALISRFTDLIAAHGFHYLLTRFTEPSELFGPLDLAAFRERQEFHVRTKGMLPEAQIAFLDEVFQGSSAILNALLTLVNERIYHNGAQRQRVPLMSLVAASNLLPEDPALAAFADRFALRQQVDPVADDGLEALLELGWRNETDRIDAQAAGGHVASLVSAAEVNALQHRLKEVDLEPIQPLFAEIIRELRAGGVGLSDRRVVKGLKLVAGATLLRAADRADLVDLWPLLHTWSRPDDAEPVREVLTPRLGAGAVATPQRIRQATAIADDLAGIEARRTALGSRAALAAHLSALNRLRLEVLRGHREETALLQRIDAAIDDGLSRMAAENPAGAGGGTHV